MYVVIIFEIIFIHNKLANEKQVDWTLKIWNRIEPIWNTVLYKLRSSFYVYIEIVKFQNQISNKLAIIN